MPTVAAEIARAAQDAHARARVLPRLVSTAALLGLLFAALPVEISDREYFQHARNGVGSELVIGGPLQSRTSGHWIVVMARQGDHRLDDGLQGTAVRLGPGSGEGPL